MLDVLRSLRRTTGPVLAVLAFLPPLLARLVLGIVFVPSGWGKLHDLDGVTEFFASLGIPFPALQAPFVSSVELVCGALVMVGFGARLAAVPLAATMVVALATAIWPEVEGLGDLVGRSELLYLLLCIQVAIAGPGTASADALVARQLDAEPSPGARRAVLAS